MNMTGKLFFSYFIFLFACPQARAASDTISIKDALDRGMISVAILGLGGHADECLEVNIGNLSGNDLILSIEAGRGMVSEDTTMQDILITKQYDFLLSSSEKAKLKVFGMCMKAHRRSPQKNSRFRVGKMADSLLVQLARFIDKYNYRNGTSQNAVWVLSDGNPMESMHAEGNDPNARKLLELMHKLTKRPVPWYTLEYEQDTVVLFTGKAKKLHCNYEYYVPNNSMVTVGVYKEDGHLHTILFSQKPHSPGRYDLPLVMDVSKWKKGNYFLKFFVDDQLKEKKLIVI